MLSCDIIIYHVTGLNSQVEEALWAVECTYSIHDLTHNIIVIIIIVSIALHQELASFTSQKVFICVSSVLTWARSKPLDPVSRCIDVVLH